jgi:alanyl-tRNA synthetase
MLGVDTPALADLAAVLDVEGDVDVRAVLEREETAFRRTLRAGGRLLSAELSRGGTLRGETVFKLHDTYGFPVDLTVEVARESDVDVDREGFAALMAEQRRRSRAVRGAQR